MAVLHSLPENEEEVPVDVAAWLSDVPSDLSPPDTPTKPPCKRKRSQSLHEPSAGIKPFQRTRNPYKGLKRIPFTKADLRNLRPSRSVLETPVGFFEASPETMTTVTGSPVKSDKTGKKGEKPVDPLEKQTKNVRGVRESLAAQGMYFENIESYNRYPEFQAMIFKLVFKDRGCVMKPGSAEKIQKFRNENRTMVEKAYASNLTSMVIGKERHVPSIVKEEASKLKSFDEDGLGCTEDQIFAKGVLPLFVEEVATEQGATEQVATEEGTSETSTTKVVGLTRAKADYVYGQKLIQFPKPGKASTPFISNLIHAAPGVRHAFFAMENKSASGTIEEAENQAIRAGASLVNAHRLLLKAAAFPSKEKEKPGVDDKTFAFSCCWVPRMAEIFVHWHEIDGDGDSVWHMNCVGYYMLDRDDELHNFRRDIYNILDWGISSKRKDMLKEMVTKIAGKNPKIESPQQLK